MAQLSQGRMLLSHNFDLADDRVPPLTREAFTQIFVDGFQDMSDVSCRAIDNPHWIVEICFPTPTMTAEDVGDSVARLLHAHRQRTLPDGNGLSDILILGGLKTTPATSDSPDALQPGQWGVDVVETASGDRFLAGINWDSAIADKEPDTIFKVQIN